MKNIIMFFLISSAISTSAQQVYPLSNYDTDVLKNNNHIKDIGGVLDPFIGIWKWIDPNNPNTYLILNLFKVEDWNFYNLNFYMDFVFGNYKYVVNGVTIIDILNHNITNDSQSNQFAPLSGTFAAQTTVFSDLNISFIDVLKNKGCNANLKLINSNDPLLKAEWTVRDRESWNDGSRPPKQQGFSIPNNVVLIKQ